jgi:hypothetical protein
LLLLIETDYKSSFVFTCIAIGGRKDTIEGEAYAKIPFRLQENSLIQSDSPLTTIYPTRSSTETPQGVSINDQKKFLLKDFGKLSSKNNHYYESNLDINQQTKTCNEFLKIYLMQQTKNRLIINRFRLFSRRLFKFRRKKSFNQMNFNNNYNHTVNQESSKITIEQILNRQWMQAFEHRKSETRISLFKTNTEESSCCSYSSKTKYLFLIDRLFCMNCHP